VVIKLKFGSGNFRSAVGAESSDFNPLSWPGLLARKKKQEAAANPNKD